MFKIEIDTGNDAFAGDASFEISRALRSVAERIRLHGFGDVQRAPIRDSNGNAVGEWQFNN